MGHIFKASNENEGNVQSSPIFALLFYSIFRTITVVSSKLYFVEICQLSLREIMDF